METEALRKFYFSNSSSFGAYKTAADKRGSSRNANNSSVNTSGVSVNDVSMPSPIQENRAQEHQPIEQTASAIGVGVGMNAVRTVQQQSQAKKALGGPKKDGSGPVPGAASPAYFNFLRQQQEVQKQHNRLEETITSLETSRRNHQAELNKLRIGCTELLKQIEESTEWQLSSKYDLQQLIRDSNMTLQPIELVEDVPPQTLGIKQISQHLAVMKEKRQATPQFRNYNLFVDQAIRRLGLLETSLAEGNVDSTPHARIPDTLLIQFDQCTALPTVEAIITPFEETIDLATFNAEEAIAKRNDAISNGEVHIAEKLCYDIITHHENMVAQVVAKAQALEKEIQDNDVLRKVRQQYLAKANEDFEKLQVRSQRLKTRCEDDMKKMFALREKVEEVEAQTSAKVMEERERSDKALQENSRKMEAVFAQMDELEKQMEVLERERHREIQRRVAEKDKDEHRRSEFSQFCHLVDSHSQPLERTIRNMDLNCHSAEVLGELCTSGFGCIHDDLEERGKLLAEVKLEAHKQHVEVLRGLMVELGEMVYKKERMVEETDKSIRQAHIQQELLTETFNPNAKKFGDIKKKLLLTRDEIESDVRELKQRAAAALELFKYSEDQLGVNHVSFVHPASEEQHHRLAIRTKMVEFKAMALGHAPNVSSVAFNGSGNNTSVLTAAPPTDLMAQIEALKAAVNESKTEIEDINSSTRGTMSKALPLVRAATKSLRK